MDPEGIMLSEISQTENLYMLSLLHGNQKRQLIVTGSRTGLPRRVGEIGDVSQREQALLRDE